MHMSSSDAIPTRDSSAAALALPADPAWHLEALCYQPPIEPIEESRLAVSNGFLSVRGSLEQPAETSCPRTYVAGLFDTPPHPPYVPSLVSAPDCLRLRVIVDGTPVSFETGETIEHLRSLDLRRGVLLRSWRWRDSRGSDILLRTLRFVSLADRALAAQLVRIEVSHPVYITLEAWCEPLDERLVPIASQGDLTVWRTAHPVCWLAIATRMTLRLDGRTRSPAQGDRTTAGRWSWQATPARPATFSRLIAVVRRDHEECIGDEALAQLHRAQRRGPTRLLADHARAWDRRWRASDVIVEGDTVVQRALRFAIYHLNGAANPADERVSIGARALTGDAYRGHVFWDTELFLLPFYICTWPEAARALLMYRYHTLAAARAKARQLGYQGAFYAWESADTGEEATPRGLIGRDGKEIIYPVATDEVHISAAVAYAVWQYWEITGDDAFLCDVGAEIILETARFWASRATGKGDGRYHIRNVIGPDEYHEDVDDNAYTNLMAQWNIHRGLEVARLLAARWPARWAELRRALDITSEELAVWRDTAERLVTGWDELRGLFEQFVGYFDLETIDLTAYEPRTKPLDVLLGRARTQGSQVIKQADVVMLLALLWDSLPPEVREANFRYYAARTGHGSSLSPAIHALVAARLGDVDLAEQYFQQAAAIDRDDAMNKSAGGIHIATQAGLWQAVIFGFAGIRLDAQGIHCDPHLPPTWRRLAFPLQWRGRLVRFDITQECLVVTALLEHGEPFALTVGSSTRTVRAGQPCTWHLNEPGEMLPSG
jgi:trehalose/maltose hydrolase-like predicted phosphorylase